MTDLEIVQEARVVTDGNIDHLSRKVESLKKYLDNWPPEHLQFKLAQSTYYTQQLNSWLAHKAFFERHTQWDGFDAGEWSCGACSAITDFEYLVPYPCPELVAQAKAIMGVE